MSQHEKLRLKTGGPPSKPKYYLMTDSEQVPWGKGEIEPWIREWNRPWNWMLTNSQSHNMWWWRTFCIMSQRLYLY